MKVKITADTRKWLTLEELPAAQTIIRDMREEDAAADLEILAGFFHAPAPKEYTAEIAGNGRVLDAYMEGSGRLDVWIETTLPETWEDGKHVIYKVGCYLTDIWSIGGVDADELRSHMYVRRFVEE